MVAPDDSYTTIATVDMSYLVNAVRTGLRRSLLIVEMREGTAGQRHLEESRAERESSRLNMASRLNGAIMGRGGSQEERGPREGPKSQQPQKSSWPKWQVSIGMKS